MIDGCCEINSYKSHWPLLRQCFSSCCFSVTLIQANETQLSNSTSNSEQTECLPFVFNCVGLQNKSGNETQLQNKWKPQRFHHITERLNHPALFKDVASSSHPSILPNLLNAELKSTFWSEKYSSYIIFLWLRYCNHFDCYVSI